MNNRYIATQILNMINFTNTFKQSCQMAATEDDGTIDKEEKKQLDQINKACDEFIKQLNKIK